MRPVTSGFPLRRYPARTMPALLSLTVRACPDKTFLSVVDPAAPERAPGTLTFRAFHERVRRAAALLRDAGLGAGDRLLLLAENSPDWQVFCVAAQVLR